MKNSINRAGLVLGASLGGLLLVVQGFAAPGAGKQHEWRFDTNDSPATPDAASIPAAAFRAVILPGHLSTGWRGDNALFGSEHGVWDLGSRGAITLTNAGNFAGGSVTQLTVKVRQWHDGGIFSQAAKVSVSGARLEATDEVIVRASSGFGDWLTQETRWTVASGVPVNAVVITGAATGSLVDSVVLQAASLIGDAPILAIRAAPAGGFEITWPASFSGMVLQSASDLGAAGGWSAVDLPVHIAGDTCTVTVDASGSMHYFRLKQP